MMITMAFFVTFGLFSGNDEIALMISLLWDTRSRSGRHTPKHAQSSRTRERAADRRLGSEMGGGALDARAHVLEPLARLELSERE